MKENKTISTPNKSSWMFASVCYLEAKNVHIISLMNLDLNPNHPDKMLNTRSEDQKLNFPL